MVYDWAKIGRRIKKERKLLDLTQDEFCAKAGIVKRATLSKWENGKSGEITVGMLTAMCEVFDCELGYLLCEYDTKRTRTINIIVEYPDGTYLHLKGDDIYGQKSNNHNRRA